MVWPGPCSRRPRDERRHEPQSGRGGQVAVVRGDHHRLAGREPERLGGCAGTPPAAACRRARARRRGCTSHGSPACLAMSTISAMLPFEHGAITNALFSRVRPSTVSGHGSSRCQTRLSSSRSPVGRSMPWRRAARRAPRGAARRGWSSAAPRCARSPSAAGSARASRRRTGSAEARAQPAADHARAPVDARAEDVEEEGLWSRHRRVGPEYVEPRCGAPLRHRRRRPPARHGARRAHAGAARRRTAARTCSRTGRSSPRSGPAPATRPCSRCARAWRRST